MSKKLFVGSLSWGTDEYSLRAAFEQFGQIEEVKLITDRETGRSRGFGFVTFIEDEDAKKAIEQMDGRELDGRTIAVNEARERGDRGGGGRRGGGGYDGGGGRGRGGRGGGGGGYGGGGGGNRW